MILSKCAVCYSIKLKFMKEQEARGLLIKKNAIINKFTLAGDKFMLEIHLRQPGFMYSACGPFTKNKERIKKQEIQDIFIKTNQISLFST